MIRRRAVVDLDAEGILRDLGMRGDIIKAMHRAARIVVSPTT
jgi:hypothetical protein